MNSRISIYVILFLIVVFTSSPTQHGNAETSYVIYNTYYNDDHGFKLCFRKPYEWKVFTNRSELAKLGLKAPSYPFVVFLNIDRVTFMQVTFKDVRLETKLGDLQRYLSENIKSDPAKSRGLRELLLTKENINGNEAIIWIFKVTLGKADYISANAFFKKGTKAYYFMYMTPNEIYKVRKDEFSSIIHSFDFITSGTKEAFSIRGKSYIERGQFDIAIMELKKAISINPNYADAHYNLGLAYKGKGLLDQTTKEFKKALAIDLDNKQFLADLGWSYVQSGKVDQGLPLLIKAPREPSYPSELLFPTAEDADQRRVYFLRTIEKMNERFDGSTLIIAHIFLRHTSHEEIIDPELIQSLKSVANETGSPIYYDALSSLYYHIKDWPNATRSIETAIHEIQKRQLDISNKEHLSHYYYNAACGHSRMGDFEKAKDRLKETFSIDRSLYSWSLKDPGLKGLRNHMGIENYKSVFGP